MSPCQILAKNTSKIINHNILHTHQMWVLWQGKHFPTHQMKPCQLDWQKLVILEKIYSVEEKTSHFINMLCFNSGMILMAEVPHMHRTIKIKESSISPL